jgi:hypothetical protein
MFAHTAARAIIAAAVLSLAGVAEAQEALTCNVGSLERTFGGTPWIVHGCNDGKSLVVVSTADNPASPFYFVLLWNGSVPDHGYRVSGEGTGNREASAAAFSELRALTRQQIEAVSAEAQSATN